MWLKNHIHVVKNALHGMMHGINRVVSDTEESRVFANGPGNRGSIPGRVIPKIQKKVLDAVLLSTQHYKVRIKVKWINLWNGVAPSPTPWCCSYWKGSLRVTLDYSRQLYLSGKRVALFPTPWCCSYLKGCHRAILDFSHQLMVNNVCSKLLFAFLNKEYSILVIEHMCESLYIRLCGAWWGEWSSLYCMIISVAILY